MPALAVDEPARGVPVDQPACVQIPFDLLIQGIQFRGHLVAKVVQCGFWNAYTVEHAEQLADFSKRIDHAPQCRCLGHDVYPVMLVWQDAVSQCCLLPAALFAVPPRDLPDCLLPLVVYQILCGLRVVAVGFESVEPHVRHTSSSAVIISCTTWSLRGRLSSLLAVDLGRGYPVNLLTL